MSERTASVASVGASKKARLKSLLTDIRAAHAAEGRNFARLNYSIYTAYACESFLRAVVNSPYADVTALKGGTMFRVWNGNLSRPTVDIDFQVTETAALINPDAVRERLLAMVSDPSFASETGVVVRPERLKVSQINEAIFPGSWRIEGPVMLGEADQGGMEAMLCVEVTFAPVPEWLTERRTIAPLLAKDEAIVGALVATKEWMAAEKLHAIAWHGAGNTRFKDYYDLTHVLMPDAAMDSVALQQALSFVVESKANAIWPATADGGIGLTAAFATAEKEAIWQQSQWGNFEGRSFNAERDLTLAEACELLAQQAEERNLLSPCPVAGMAAALRNLAQAGDVGQAEQAMIALAEGGVDARRLQARCNALAWRSGQPKLAVADVFVAALERLKTGGIGEVLAAAWEDRTGYPLKRDVARIAEGLIVRDRTVVRQETSRKERQEVAEVDLEQVQARLATAPANLWPNLLATLVKAQTEGKIDRAEVADPPFSMGLMRRAWQGVAKKQGLPTDLDVVLADLRGGPALRR
jgi:hypothetical protein